jgi:hypothetical protein
LRVLLFAGKINKQFRIGAEPMTVTISVWGLSWYLVSVFIGHIVIATLMHCMRRLVGIERDFWRWSDFFIGATERLMATTLVIFAPSYLPAFIGGWVKIGRKLAATRKQRNS